MKVLIVNNEPFNPANSLRGRKQPERDQYLLPALATGGADGSTVHLILFVLKICHFFYNHYFYNNAASCD